MTDDERKEFGKQLLGAVLSSRGTVQINVPIPVPTLTLDLWFDACPLDADVRERLGLLGRMLAQGRCLIERCYKPCSDFRVDNASLKQLEYDRRRQLAAGSKKKYARDIFLWITVPSGPHEEYAEKWLLQPKDGWPEGFWWSPPFANFCMVFMDEIPETPETRILHRLTRHATRSEAFEDLDRAGLSRSVWAHKIVLPGDTPEDDEEDDFE